MSTLPAPLRAYRIGMTLLRPVLPRILAWRMRRGKEDEARLPERRGIPGLSRPPGCLVWLHGASVGETLSLLPLIEQLTRRGIAVLVTSGTLSSARLLAKRLPPGAFHQFVPLDAPAYLKRFLDHWRPDLVLIAESEFWPNLMLDVADRGIPLVLVNARLSERSFRRWKRFPEPAKVLMGCFSACLAQTQADAQRLAGLGARQVSVIGNLKFDVPAPPADPMQLADMTGLLSHRTVWAAASTHDGEEEAILAAHQALKPHVPGLLTILAPRHPARASTILHLARAEGLKVAIRSKKQKPAPETDLYLIDTIGDLGLVYRLASIVFMGGSLIPHGGQNPIEPGKLGAAILHGVHVHNFAEIYALLDRDKAAWPIEDEEALIEALSRLFADPALIRRMSRAAHHAIEGLGGATLRIMNALEPYLTESKEADARP